MVEVDSVSSTHTPPSPSQRAVWMGMARLVAHITRDINRTLTDRHDLGVSELTVLGQTLALGGSARMSDLAERLQVTKPAMTKLADRLESAGRAERGDDPDDGRVTRLSVTDRGRIDHAVAERTFESEMDSLLWSHLDVVQTDAIADVLHLVQQRLGIAGNGVIPDIAS